jgi:putative acetyltransferase
VFVFKRVSPAQADVQGLIRQLDLYQIGLYGIERCNLSSIEELSDAGVFMLGALCEGDLAGIGAVKLYPNYGELKRVVVAPSFRGKGLAGQLVSVLESHALKEGRRKICLETGYLQAEAIALYRKLGYSKIPSFGCYKPNEVSIYMEKPL